MDNIVDLSSYIKKQKKQKEDKELDFLFLSVEKIMEKCGEIELKAYNETKEAFNILREGKIKSHSDSALFDAYYSLIEESRGDLADLVMEIIRMKNVHNDKF